MKASRTPTRLILCTLAFSFLLAACHSGVQRRPASVGPDLSPAPALSSETLEQRISSLRRFLESQDLSQEDRALCQDLLASYRGLKTASETGSLRQNSIPMIHTLLRNLEQLEDRYFASKTNAEGAPLREIPRVADKRNKILEAFSAGNDQAVIDGILEMEKDFGRDSVTPDLSLLFALSLAKKGTLTTALSVGEEVSRRLDNLPDLLTLRSRMIEWHLSLGNEKEAKEILHRLQERMSERQALVRALERGVTGQDSKPSLSESGGFDEASPDENSEKGLKEALEKAEESIEKGDFEKAKFILFQQRIRFDEGPEVEQIDQALRRIERAEEKAVQKGKPQVAAIDPAQDSRKDVREEAQKQDRLKVCLDLLRSEKYEEALAEIGGLPPEDPDVKELKNTAVEKIVNRERNKAAKLFLTARNTKNPTEKADLLTSSYNILKAVLDKYPSSPLSPRIQDNMNQVMKELARVKGG